MFDFARTIAPAALTALDLERIAIRHEALERERAGRALETDGLEVVLDDRRDAVERPDEAALLRTAVEVVGFREGIRIDEDDGVDRRSCLVVRLDPLEVLLDEPAACELPGLHRGVNAARWSSLLAGTPQQTAVRS